MFETFEASYSQVQEIKLSVSPDSTKDGAALVTIALSSAPTIGESKMGLPRNGQPTTLMFHLHSNDVTRFLKSLHSRALVGLTLLAICTINHQDFVTIDRAIASHIPNERYLKQNCLWIWTSTT